MMSVMIAIAVKQRSNLALQTVAKVLVLGWNFRVSKDRQSLFAGVDGLEGSIQKKKPRSHRLFAPVT